MRVLVCGGRNYNDAARVAHILGGIRDMAEERRSRLVIVHGGAPGADALAARWASTFPESIDVEAHFAEWERYGRSAGPRRNKAMLATGIDLVVAFPGGRGTADMVRRARVAGVGVLEVPE